MNLLEVTLVSPRGFCAGVERAITIVERALERYGSPIYVKHEIVHNASVIAELREKGVVFVEHIDEIPVDDRPVIFSAHGVAQVVRDQANQRALLTIDATCPLVTKVHLEVRRAVEHGALIVFVGHANHPEALGTVGQAPHGSVVVVETLDDVAKLSLDPSQKMTYVTQTTLSVFDTAHIVDALKARYPNIEAPKRQDICFATENRQRALMEVAPHVEAFIVIGSANSSNTSRLYEIALRATQRKMAWRIDQARDLPMAQVMELSKIGITAGASAPIKLVEDTLQWLRHHRHVDVKHHVSTVEDVHFAIPSLLR